MASTTDLDEASQSLPVLLPPPPPLPQPVPGDEPLASRGHPGGPGFAVPGPPAGASVWLRVQAAWLAAGAEWSGPARPAPPVPAGSTPPGPMTSPAPARRARWPLLVAVAVVLVLAAAAGGYEWFTAGRLGPRDYPAAQTGGFGTAQGAAGRGVFQTLTQAASSGDTVVAVGSQAGGDLTRAQFFVSADAGNTWRAAPVRAAAGGDPAPGHPAQLIAGGSGGWLAVGPHAIWTSTNATSWTLAETTGITPTDSGDQVRSLVRTATGYLAAGDNLAEGTGVLWTSKDGLHWQRETAAQALLPVHHGTIVTITGAAAHGPDILLSGQVSPWYEVAGPRTTATWLSTDGGLTWRAVSVPVSDGAVPGLCGLAAAGAGFIAVRPGQAGLGGIVYASANGASWRYVTTLSSGSGLKVTAVNGGAGGYTVLGQVPRGAMYGFTSTDGTHWKLGGSFGDAPGTITGSTLTASGVLVATGVTGTTPIKAAEQRPYLAVAVPGHPARAINVARIAGATITQASAAAVAVSGRQYVAVGEAGGRLAVWSGTAGSLGHAGGSPTQGTWATATGQPPSVAGTQRLTSVAHGPAGWLAIGQALAGTTSYPVAAASPDGRTWHLTRSGALAASHAVAVQAAASQDGYVVVGRAVTSAGTVPALWWSRDLRTWTRGHSGAGPGQLLGVASGTSGFVAVGAHGTDPAVWTSADGRHWAAHALKVPGAGASAQLSKVAVNGRTAVAFGQETWASGRQATFAEVSHDGGRTWTPVPFAGPGGTARSTHTGTTVTAVTAMSGGFTAAGSYGPAGDRDVAVWTSPNGDGWLTQTVRGTGLSGPGIQQVSGLAAAGTALTGVGFTATATAEQPTLWQVPGR